MTDPRSAATRSAELRHRLTGAALELGALLNTVADDDTRDLLHGHVEKVINDELYAGSLNRAHAAKLIDLFTPAGRVVDLFSRRVPFQTAAVRPDVGAGNGRPQEVTD